MYVIAGGWDGDVLGLLREPAHETGFSCHDLAAETRRRGLVGSVYYRLTLANYYQFGTHTSVHTDRERAEADPFTAVGGDQVWAAV